MVVECETVRIPWIGHEFRKHDKWRDQDECYKCTCYESTRISHHLLQKYCHYVSTVCHWQLWTVCSTAFDQVSLIQQHLPRRWAISMILFFKYLTIRFYRHRILSKLQIVCLSMWLPNFLNISTILPTYYVVFHTSSSDTDKMYVRHQTNYCLIVVHTINK